MTRSEEKITLPVGSVTERDLAKRLRETGHSIFVIASYLGTTPARVTRMLEP